MVDKNISDYLSLVEKLVPLMKKSEIKKLNNCLLKTVVRLEKEGKI